MSADKAACIERYESAQELRRQGKLTKAREALLACASATCPALLQTDCMTWLAEVSASLPSIVLAARSEAGDETDVVVRIDGQPTATHLDGKAIEIDAGQHVFRFERAPFAPVEKTVLIAEGEKNRVISALLVDPNAPPPPPPRGSPEPEGTRPVPALTFVMLGVTVAGAGAFAGLGASALADRDALAQRCSPFCTNDDVKGLKTKQLIADVAIGVAGVAATVALVSLLTRPTIPAPRKKQAESTFGIQPFRAGALLNLAGEF